MTNLEEISMKVIVFRESHMWVAQGIEHDICVSASTMDELQERFMLTVTLEMNERLEKYNNPLHGIEKAPQHYWDLWQKKSMDLIPLQEPKSDLPNFQMALAA